MTYTYVRLNTAAVTIRDSTGFLLGFLISNVSCTYDIITRKRKQMNTEYAHTYSNIIYQI